MKKLLLATGVVAAIGSYTLASAEIKVVTQTTTETRSLTPKAQADADKAARAAPTVPAAQAATVTTVSKDSDGDRTVTRMKSDGSSVLEQRSSRRINKGLGVVRKSRTLKVKPDGSYVDRSVKRTVTW